MYFRVPVRKRWAKLSIEDEKLKKSLPVFTWSTKTVA